MQSVNETHVKNRQVSWAFASGKGGVGKTFIVAGLGVILAQKGYDVIILDGDLGGANLHTALGVDPPGQTLSDFTSGKTGRLDELAVGTPYANLRIIGGAFNNLGAANLNFTTKYKLFKHFKSLKCDYLLIDGGSGASYNSIDLFLAADLGALVVTPERSAMELTYRFIKALIFRQLKAEADWPLFEGFIDEGLKESRSGNMIEATQRVLDKIAKSASPLAERLEKEIFNLNTQIIVNNARDYQDQSLGLSVCDVIDKFYSLSCGYLGYIPYDQRVITSGNNGRPFVVEHGSSETVARLLLVLEEFLKVTQAFSGKSQMSLI